MGGAPSRTTGPCSELARRALRLRKLVSSPLCLHISLSRLDAPPKGASFSNNVEEEERKGKKGRGAGDCYHRRQKKGPGQQKMGLGMTMGIADGRRPPRNELVAAKEGGRATAGCQRNGLLRPARSSTGWMVADGQKIDRRAPLHVVTCGGGLATGHAGGPDSQRTAREEMPPRPTYSRTGRD